MGVQVRELTYSGEEHLSATSRSFISFRWGERDIEEFNLIITYGDRLSKGVYSGFEDVTTTLEGKDGLLFWKSYYKPNELSFTLSTDGMSAREMEDFKQYFKPGFSRKLILSEYPNRYAEARVAAAPTIEMIPFEEKVTFKGREIRTTTYKGDISISFIMDDPYWYAVDTLLENELNEDDLQAIYNDGVPCKDEIKFNNYPATLILGNNKYCMLEQRVREYNTNYTEQNAFLAESGMDLFTYSKYYFYNPSTAPVNTILSFTFSTADKASTGEASDWYWDDENADEIFDTISIKGFQGNDKITFYPQVELDGSTLKIVESEISGLSNVTYQWQKYNNGVWEDLAEATGATYDGSTANVYRVKVTGYNESQEYDVAQFKILYPAPITSAKEAIKIVKNSKGKSGVSLIDLRNEIRDTITHRYMRNAIYKYLSNLISEGAENLELSTIRCDSIINKIKELTPIDYAVYFDTKKGISKLYYMDEEKSTYVEENAGDMVYDRYLILEEHNQYTLEEDGTPSISEYECFTIQTDKRDLNKFRLEYNYAYV